MSCVPSPCQAWQGRSKCHRSMANATQKRVLRYRRAQPSTNTNSQSATVNAVETEAVQVKANLQPTFYHNPLTPFPNSLRQTARASSRCSAPSWLRPRPSRISPTSRTAPHPNSYPNSIPHRNHNPHPHLHPSPNSNPNPKPHCNPNPHLQLRRKEKMKNPLRLSIAAEVTLTLIRYGTVYGAVYGPVYGTVSYPKRIWRPLPSSDATGFGANRRANRGGRGVTCTVEASAR